MDEAAAQARAARRAHQEGARRKLAKLNPAQRAASQEEHVGRSWRPIFLAALAETSNVKGACKTAGISTSRAYNARREEPDFARAWSDARYEGYEHLEFEVLDWLRNSGTAGAADRKFDVANAIRFLAAHREAVARERARRDHADEQEVLDSIDRMLDDMRERAAANAALAADHQNESG